MGTALCLLTVVALYVWGVHSWDIAVSVGDKLNFYDNGIKRSTVILKSHNPAALAYDAVNNMILYVDKQKDNDTICGYYISSTKNVCFIKRNGRNINSLAYEPRTKFVYFTDTNERSINWISLKHGWSNEINGNLLIKLDEGIPADIAVDGCKGNIYWIIKKITKNYCLERARLDGSKREISMFIYPLHSMGMNLPEQEIYYFSGCETCYTKSLIRADLNFRNEDKLYNEYHDVSPEELTVTKDYIYWINSGRKYKSLWQLPKPTKRNVSIPEPIKISQFDALSTLGITANYEINGLQDCNSLPSLMSNLTITLSDSSDVFDLCDKFCPYANCSIDAGLPNCSREAGYIGERFNIFACDGYCFNNGNCSFKENTGPVCQCQADRIGDRCEASACLNYCLQGNCSFSDEGLPTCSCNDGYTGKRCEVSVCCGYCLNGGDCSLNENEQPVCQCVGDHEGTRCEFTQNILTVNNSSTYYSVQKNTSLVDLVSGRKPAAKISVNVEVLVV